jgi:hypothetical protein
VYSICCVFSICTPGLGLLLVLLHSMSGFVTHLTPPGLSPGTCFIVSVQSDDRLIRSLGSSLVLAQSTPAVVCSLLVRMRYRSASAGNQCRYTFETHSQYYLNTTLPRFPSSSPPLTILGMSRILSPQPFVHSAGTPMTDTSHLYVHCNAFA